MPARVPPWGKTPDFRRSFLPAIVLLCGAGGILQGAPIASFARYDSSKGMVADHVTAIQQDGKGYLWLGTKGGLSRFDGENFDNFNLADDVASDEVVEIFEDKGGSLWFLTSSGVKEYDGRGFRSLTTATGLPDNAVTAMIQDRQGNLWFGTKKGIAVFRDRKLVAVPGLDDLKEKRVNVLYEDSTGRIWVGFRRDGLSVFEQGRWRSFSSQDGLPHDIVNDIREGPDRRIWVATHRGVAVFDKGHLEAAPFSDQLPTSIIYSIAVDSAGGLWFRTSGSGVARWDGTSLQPWSTANGLAGDYVTSMVEDDEGTVWLGTNRGLSRWSRGRLMPASETESALAEHISTIYRDRDARLWFGTESGLFGAVPTRIEVVAEDEKTEQISRFTSAPILYKDRRGGLWFPTSRGLGFTDGERTIFYSDRDGLPGASVRRIVEDAGGTLWVSTPAGIAHFHRDAGRFITLTQPLVAHGAFKLMEPYNDGVVLVREDNTVILVRGREVVDLGERGLSASSYTIEHVVVDPQKNLWFQTTGGLIRYDGTRSRYHPADEVMPSAFLSNMLRDNSEGMWVGTSRGLVRWRKDQFRRFTAAQGLPKGLVTLLGQDSTDALWMTLMSGDQNVLSRIPIGLVKWDGEAFSLFTTKEGLPSNDVLGFFEHPKGTLWFRTDKGIGRYDGRAFKTFTVTDGMANNAAGVLLEGPHGGLWIGTRNGISHYRDGLFSSYGTADGLRDGSIEDLAFDRRATLWARTATGVHRLTESKVPPRLELIDVAIGGRTRALDPDLRLRHDENNLFFRFRGINLLEGGASPRYLYRLEGFSGEWFGPVTETKIAFHNLEPGAYRLQVKALNRALIESRPPVEFAFVILPPYWETWWFRIGALAVLCLSVYGTYRFRLRAKLEKARILNELQTAHDMQMGLMPAIDPEVPGFDISGMCKPAFEVGGDYFDYFWMDEERTRLGIAVADVTGKAMKASIIAVMTSGMVLSEVGNQKAPGRILENINRPLFLKTDPHFFTTMLFAVLDIPRKTLTFANAGHLPPLVSHDGCARHFQTTGTTLPLGLESEIQLDEMTLQLAGGDRVLFYTDGLVEAMSEAREMFGFARLERAFQEISAGSSEEIMRRLLDGIDRFKGRAAQHDDITLVVVSVL